MVVAKMFVVVEVIRMQVARIAIISMALVEYSFYLFDYHLHLLQRNQLIWLVVSFRLLAY
jgi:hypothetical protein